MKSGIDRFIEEAHRFKNSKFVLIANQASVTENLVPVELALAEKIKIEAILSPQHGFFQEKQANMIEAEEALHPYLKIPIYPLYNREMKIPEVALESDFLIFDLQDVGVRVYTYIWSLYLLMKELSGKGVTLIILDRPNPLGGEEVEGNLLEPELFSFVGLHPLPMRHGMTVAELALMFREELALDLEVVIYRADWKRNQKFPDYASYWINPSPNLPSFNSALVYAGTVIFEGTNISEGRGTTRPFEFIGAPFIDGYSLAKEMQSLGLDGVIFKPAGFTPTFDKHRDNLCMGVQIIVTDRERFKPYKTALLLARQIWQSWREAAFNPPPYEYCYDKLPFDIITGSRRIREWIESGGDMQELEEIINAGDFSQRRKKYLLYR